MPTFIKSITFSSISSDNNNKSQPTYYLKDRPIEISEGYCVQSFQGVNTVLNIDSRNNRFAFLEDDSPGVTRSFTIPQGNYTITTFLAAIKSGLDINGTVIYTVTNNTLINKITISGASKQFRIIPTSSDCYYECGFIISPSFNITQIATNTYDLSGLKTIHILCNSFGSGNSIICNRNMNIICSIPVECPYLGVINFNPNIVFIDSQITSISAFEFIFLDERFRVLEMQNDHHLKLLFEV